MSEQRTNQRPQTALDDLTLFAPCPSAEGSNGGKKPWSRLHFGWFKNKFQFSVATGDPADKGNDNGWIRFEFSTRQFDDFMLKWEQLNNTTDPTDKLIVNVEARQWNNQEKKSTMMPAGSVVIGKKDGIYYLAGISWKKDRPKVQFVLGEDRFHHYVKANGEPFGNDEMSRMVSIALQRRIQSIVDHLIKTAWVPEERKDAGNRNGNNGNGGQNGGSYDNGNSRQQTDGGRAGGYEEELNDIPF